VPSDGAPLDSHFSASRNFLSSENSAIFRLRVALTVPLLVCTYIVFNGLITFEREVSTKKGELGGGEGGRYHSFGLILARRKGR